MPRTTQPTKTAYLGVAFPNGCLPAKIYGGAGLTVMTVNAPLIAASRAAMTQRVRR